MKALTTIRLRRCMRTLSMMTVLPMLLLGLAAPSVQAGTQPQQQERAKQEGMQKEMKECRMSSGCACGKMSKEEKKRLDAALMSEIAKENETARKSF